MKPWLYQVLISQQEPGYKFFLLFNSYQVFPSRKMQIHRINQNVNEDFLRWKRLCSWPAIVYNPILIRSKLHGLWDHSIKLTSMYLHVYDRWCTWACNRMKVPVAVHSQQTVMHRWNELWQSWENQRHWNARSSTKFEVPIKEGNWGFDGRE